MKQKTFEQLHQPTWDKIEQALKAPREANNSSVLSDNYMLLCQHLALAKQRMYSNTLIERLNKLVLSVYREIYRYQRTSRFNFFAFFLKNFPLAIYQHRNFVWLSLFLFLVPGLISGLWIYLDEFAIYSVIDGPDVRSVEKMYDPAAEVFGRERESDTDIFMFGFYIKNNISIAFNCFAGGLVGGIVTVLVLIFNGLHIGSIAGHLTRLEYFDTFYPFVITHGSFELTAIVFSGAAGLKLGYSILNPGAFSRLTALKLAGRESVTMVYGIFLMLVIAAFIEAFWSSSSSIPNMVKYSVGAFCWLLVILYSFSGRRFGSQ